MITCPRCSRQVVGGKFCPGCGARIDDPFAGKLLAGKWKIVSQTAKGVFFSTYRAEPKTGGVPVAVKVLDPVIGEVDDRRRRFLENAGAALSLTDRRLLAVREMAEELLERTEGKARGAVYAVADAPGGPSLSDIVAKQGAMAPARAVACIKGLLEALAAVHGAGLVHGDLHPACVFLEPDGSGREQVRLADAGLAQGLGPTGAEAGDPSILGSDGGRWLSPEQASGQAPGPASDIHAAGALLYFALTGIHPWQAEKGQPLLFEIQRSFPRAATEVKLEIPESMDALIDRALAKAPGERYKSASEFARILGQTASGLAAAAAPAVPDDITPGAMTLGGIPALEEALPEPRRPAPSQEDATMTAMPPRAGRAASGDETLVGTAAPARPPVAPPRAPAPAAPTTALPRPPAAKPVPPPASRAAANAPSQPARPAAKPAPARKAPPPPEPDSDETLPAGPRTAKVAPPGPPGKQAKVRGPWSVGTPVAVFAILGFLGVGTLYGFVWAGTFDWKIPPWVRTLTGRDAAAEIPDTVKILEQASIPMILNVEFTLPEIRKPMDAETRPPVYGSWRIIKDPPGSAGTAEPGAAPPDVKVFASGDLAGAPSETGVIQVKHALPPGKYQLEGEVWCGTIGRRDPELKPIPFFEVAPDKNTVVSFKIETRPTTLTVNIRPQAKAVITIVNASVGTTRKPLQKEIARGEGSVRFGLDSDMAKGRLFLGETWTIKVSADGKKPKEQPVTLDGEPTTAEVNLEEDPQGKVGQAKKLILETELMPPEFENDAAVLGSPEIMVAMGMVCVKNGAWPKVEDYMLSLKSVEPRSLPGEAARFYADYHKHLRELGQEAAAKGDVVRVREFRAKARPDVLESAAAAEEKRAWAEIEANAWLGFPQGAQAADAELDPVQRMIHQDITLLPDPLRKRIAQRLLENRAWPAWRAGNELRPPSPTEKATSITVPGPAVQPWITLAKKAYDIKSDPALLLSWQRLSARLEDLESRPENVVKLLANDDEWNPGKGILEPRKDLLFKKDRLLLARALARWGALREQASAAEATKLREIALQVYQTCFDPEVNLEDPERSYPEPLAAAARAEAVGMAVLAKDAGTVQKLLDMYLALRGGDDWARRLKEDLNRPAAIPVPTLMQAEGLLVEVPGGLFLVGSPRSAGELEEQPFKDPKAGVIKVNVLYPPARTRVQPFLVGVREVTWGQYKNYLEEMKTPEKVRLYAHPAEPTEKNQPGSRMPERTETWADGDPVRGVDWWDAYACARYLGGRLPTEAEWEKAARWCGRETPFPDPMPAYRADFTVEFIKYWKDNMRDLSVFDVAPSGARGFWGGVSEWTLDSFKFGPPAPKDGIVEGVAPWPTVLPSDNVMCVRGGSNYHLPPGEAPGDSPLETKEKSREPPPAPGVLPPPERARVWRAMDILERRGVPVGTRAKWLGFRIVVGVPASTTTAR